MKLCQILTLAVSFAFPCVLFSQSTNASLTGVVDDPSKAVIPKVSVTAINTETGVKTQTFTNHDGQYVLTGLIPGPYRVELDKQGFKGIIEAGLVLHVEDAVQINFHMAVGSMSETVTVTAGSELQETTGAVSTVIDQTEIANMPLNGNSLATLFELVPGVVTNASGGAQSSGGGISVDGQRSTTNSLTVDGTGANIYMPTEYGYSNVTGAGIPVSASGGTNGLLPTDAVEEFRMQTSSYDAQYGRTPGGQIELKTRGGTNAYHGSLFENFRNQVMDAQDWFIAYDNDVYGENLTQSPLRMNDFGGTFGGPVLKNRLFFFVAHESLLMDQPQTPTTYDVPDQATLSSVAPVFEPFLSSYPSGNGGPDPSKPGSDFYIFQHSNTIADHTTSARIDADLPKNMHAFFRVNDAPSSLNDPFPNYGLLTGINILTVTSGLSSRLSPNTINEVTGSYSAYNTSFSNEPSALENSYIKAVSGLVNPSTTIVDFLPSAWPAVVTTSPETTSYLHQFNLVDTLTWSRRTHTLKVGMDYRRASNHISFTDALYLYAGQSLTDFQNGTLDSAQYLTHSGGTNFDISNLSLFLNDNWRIGTRLILDYGVRWEFDPPPQASSGLAFVAMQGDPNDPSTIALAPSGTTVYKTRFDNFAPRFGFAYTVRSGAQFATILRGGGGVFFDTGQGSAAANAAGLSYPYSLHSAVGTTQYSALNVSQLEAMAKVGLPQYQITLTDPDLVAPRTYNWSLTLDQKLGEATALSTSYVGNSAHDLLKENTFQGLSPTLTDSFGYLFVYTNGEQSSYNALQMQLRSRSTKQLSILASYTWAHALDNGSSDYESVAGYQKNYRADSDNDFRQVFSSAIHYSPNGFAGSRLLKIATGGWSLDTIGMLQSSAPWSVYSFSTTLVNPNLYNTYADVVPGVPTVVAGSQCAAETGFPCPGGKGLNPAAFAMAPGTRDGTSTRNGYRLFGLKQWDLSASRSWPLWESSQMSFRVDAFNVINTPNFSSVDDGVGDSTFGEAQSTYAGNFGGTSGNTGSLNQVFSNGAARSLQLSLKIKF